MAVAGCVENDLQVSRVLVSKVVSDRVFTLLLGLALKVDPSQLRGVKENHLFGLLHCQWLLDFINLWRNLSRIQVKLSFK